MWFVYGGFRFLVEIKFDVFYFKWGGFKLGLGWNYIFFSNYSFYNCLVNVVMGRWICLLFIDSWKICIFFMIIC